MNDQLVTTTEIADLLHHIRTLNENPGAEPAARAKVLARKADLLARIAERRAQEWTCEHADQARQIAHDAQIVADRARDALAHNTPIPAHPSVGPNQRRTRYPLNPPGGDQVRGELWGQFCLAWWACLARTSSVWLVRD